MPHKSSSTLSKRVTRPLTWLALSVVPVLAIALVFTRTHQAKMAAPAAVTDDSTAELFVTAPPLPASDRDTIASLRAQMDALSTVADTQNRLQSARIALKAGDVWRAEALLQAACKAEPANRSARLLLAQTFYEEAKFHEAQQLFLTLNRENAGEVEPYLGLAAVALTLRQKSQAWNWLAKGMNNAAPTVENLIELARRYEDWDSYKDALTALNKARQIAPEDPNIPLQRAALLVRYGAIEEGYPILEKLVREQPKEGLAYRLLAVVLMNPTSLHYDLNRARTLLETATELNVKDVEIYRLAALIYRQRHLYRLAVQAYYAELSLDPFSADGRYGLGQMYAQLGRQDLSLPQLRLYEQLRDQDRQQTLLTAAIYHHPQDADAYVRYGAFLETEGRYADMLHAYQQAANLKPQDQALRARIQQLYKRMGWRNVEGPLP